jgi:hypothetical protein
MDDHIPGDVPADDVTTAGSSTGEVVAVTVQVPVESLASFYVALGQWAQSDGGPRGRTRVA